MNTPVEDQLRDYFTMVDRMQGTLDLGDATGAGTTPNLRLVDTDTDTSNHPENTNEMEEIMLAPNKNQRPTRSRTWLVAAAAAAVVALVVAGLIVAARDDQQDPVPADEPVPTEPIVEPPVAPAGEAPEELTTELEIPVEPGTYVTDRLGMPLTFTTNSVMRVYYDTTGQFLLGELDDSTGEIAAMRVTRLGGWHTGDEAAIPVAGKAASIDPYDIEVWIADNDVVAERRPDATIDGRVATVYDVRIDPSSDLRVGCDPAQLPCFYINRVSDESAEPTQMDNISRTIFQGVSSRMWLVEIPGFDPILVEAAAGFHPHVNSANAEAFDGTEMPWLDEFETTILPTFRFGPDGPPLPSGF